MEESELFRLTRQRADGLALDGAGIWRARTAPAADVSFPLDGHEACFQIEDVSFWFAHRSACIAAALQRVPVVGPLLDVGGGNGAVSVALERAGIETVLLEPGVQGARNARRRGLRTVICATLEGAQFVAGAFGAAGLFDVLEHVIDDAALLREIRRVVRPGGHLCLTVPAYRWLWSGEDELAGHHRRYTAGALEPLLRRCGFAVDYQTYLFAALTVPVFAMRSVPHWLRRREPQRVAQAAAGHHLPSPLARRAMQALLAPELRSIRAGRRVPFGTSCLVVATAV